MSTEFKAGYAKAIADVEERINNATANGARQHWDTELLDQLLELRDERGIPTPDAED